MGEKKKKENEERKKSLRQVNGPRERGAALVILNGTSCAERRGENAKKIIQKAT